MKKITISLLSILMCLTLVACSNDNTKIEDKNEVSYYDDIDESLDEEEADYRDDYYFEDDDEESYYYGEE